MTEPDSVPSSKKRKAVDRDWRKELLVEVNRRGEEAVKASLANAITIFGNHHKWKGILAIDVFAKRVVATKPPPWHAFDAPAETECVDGTSWYSWADEDYARAQAWLERFEQLEISATAVQQALHVVARKQVLHPLRTYLDSLKWDGTHRIGVHAKDGGMRSWLATYLGAADTPYTRSIGRWWLISAIARAYKPGCQVDHMIVLEGDQGLRKSSALRHLGGAWFSDQISDIGTKDSKLEMQGIWIIELAEMSAMTKAENAATKAFLVVRADRFRAPYDKTVREHGRHCVFSGTVNDSAYLKDDTGNRRYWPVKCVRVSRHELERDRDQIWAEAREAFLAKEEWWPEDPSLKTLIEREQSDRYVDDEWITVIDDWLNRTQVFDLVRGQRSPTMPHGERISQATPRGYILNVDVLRGALEVDPNKMGRAEQMRAAACLTRLGWRRTRLGGGSYRPWIYQPPPEYAAGVLPAETGKDTDSAANSN